MAWELGNLLSKGMAKADLDPFRVLVGVIAAKQDSDLLVDLVDATGLKFKTELSGSDAYSHKMRVRALRPRIIDAYDALDEQAALGVANALVHRLSTDQALLESSTDALQRIGWDIANGQLIVVDPDLREMFFPKGSRWDAFVVLRDLVGQATAELTVVDQYCDEVVFRLLASRADRPLKVRLLAGKAAAGLVGEATAFVSQFPGWTIEVRRAASAFHDRFVVIDGSKCVHIGASINGAGKTAFMISPIEDAQNRKQLVAEIESSWMAASP